MHIYGLTDNEYTERQRSHDYDRRAKEPGQRPPPRRRALRHRAATGLRSLADSLEG